LRDFSKIIGVCQVQVRREEWKECEEKEKKEMRKDKHIKGCES
jgi:hypothetical protein